MYQYRSIIIGLGLLISASLAACGGNDNQGENSTSTVAATAQPTLRPTEPSAAATAVPTATIAVSPTTVVGQTQPLPGDIRKAIEAVLGNSPELLSSLLTPTTGPCMVNPPPAILRPPACPPGVAAGTLVPAILIGDCPDMEVGYYDQAITYRIATFSTPLPRLIGVLNVANGGPMRFAALFGYERTAWLAFDGRGHLIGEGGGGSCATFDLRPRLTNATWLVGPDWPS